MQNKYAIVIGAAALALAGLLTFWYADVFSSLGKKTNEPNVNIGGVTIAPSITDTSIPAPEIPRKVVFQASIPKEAQKIIRDHIETLTENLESNPRDINTWLDLALQYKAANDIEGAKEVWEYLTLAAPEHSLSFYNLGYLYHISLKDYAKSEEYYKKAIQMEPNQELYYTGLHELYRYSYKQETNAAVDILKQGMKQMPNSINLVLTLAGYYRDEKRDKKNAVQYFTQARDMAKEAGNNELVATLDREIAALK